MDITLIQYYLNPLHCYCCLRDIGISKNKALRIAALWERFIRYSLYLKGV